MSSTVKIIEDMTMKDQVRITVEHLVDGKVTESSIVVEQVVKLVKSIAELGFNHQPRRHGGDDDRRSAPTSPSAGVPTSGPVLHLRVQN